MGLSVWSIVLICIAALCEVYRTVCLIVSRRRAEKLGILSVKYPIWTRAEIVMFVLIIAVVGYSIIINTVNYIPRGLAMLEDYREKFSQDPELYSELIESAEYMIRSDRSQVVIDAVLIAMDLLSFLTRGAYITREGVLLFGSFKPLQTTARIKQGEIKFYTRRPRDEEKHRKYQYAFELPESEDNRELFKDFIKTTGAKA